MSKAKSNDTSFFESLKTGLEELAQDARGEISLRATVIEVPATDSQPLSYDSNTDALRIRLSDAPTETRRETKPGIFLAYDKNGNVVGVEVLDASERLPLKRKTA